MKTRGSRFNIYLAALFMALLTGCRSVEEKQMSALRVHLETNRDASGRTEGVLIYREKPFTVVIDKSPFLAESLVKSAKVVDDFGGFQIEVEFERRGSWLLEQYSTANRGRRFVIFGEFAKAGQEKGSTSRWLAAPIITHPITDGVLKFAPDATREEAAVFVRGLNNLAKKLDDSFKW